METVESDMSKAKHLRSLLRQDGVTIAPGAYDCITATLIARAGFPAVYMTGAGTAASHGYPDYGLLTMSEMVENAGRIAGAARFNLQLGMLGNVRTRTLKAFPEAAYREIIASLR